MVNRVRERISEAAFPIALSVFVLLVLSTEWTVRREVESQDTKRELETMAFGGTLLANMERELNTLLSVSHGLSSYIRVHHDGIDPVRMQALLSDLYAEVGHVRHLAVAQGYRVQYVYPLEGNEPALHLDYREVPNQLRSIEHAISDRRGVLVGPLNLVQGGQALIYRYPVFVRNEYWGVISTVINTPSFFKAAFASAESQPYVFAIRTLSESGEAGEVFYGDAGLFDDEEAYMTTSQLPDGLWQWAIRGTAPPPDRSPIVMIRVLGWTLSMIASLLIFLFLRERARLANYALYDGLTGVANRRLLAERMKQHLSLLERSPAQTCSVFLLDLNGFKQINDTHGHAAGDAVLKAVAKRITEQVRSMDTVARLGGDEYVVIVNYEKEGGRLQALEQRLRSAIVEPIDYRGKALSIDLSIGVATYPGDGKTLEQLIDTADSRMYSNKQGRKSNRAPLE